MSKHSEMIKTLQVFFSVLFLYGLKADQLYNLVRLSDSSALCLDGSLGAYYLSLGDPYKIMIGFEGGGWCGEKDLSLTLESCYQRSKDHYGSSLTYSKTMTLANGILSDNPTNYFANWTKAFLKYCDGSGHQGTKNSSVSYKDKKLYFRGTNITLAQLESLNELTGLFTKATHVVVTGYSAGGLAAYTWADSITERVSKEAKVWAVPDSSIFLDSIDRTTNTHRYREGFQSIFKIANVQIDPPTKKCVAAYPDEKVKCMFVQYLHPFISTPVFSIQSLYDSWSLPSITGIRCIHGNSLKNCNKQERAYIEQYHKNTSKVLLQSALNPHNGVWAPVCLLHTFTLSTVYESINYEIPAHSGNTVGRSVRNWIQDTTDNHNHIDSGEWPDNAPCSS